jgi:hypothetical protein
MSRHYTGIENAQTILMDRSMPAMRDAVRKWCEENIGMAYENSIDAYISAQKMSRFKMMLHDDGEEDPHLIIPLYGGRKLRVWLHSLVQSSIEDVHAITHVMDS